MTLNHKTLFPFQDEGARFLASNPRAYLGDEMGLGKTPQAIHAFNLTGLPSVHATVPASAVSNWHREIHEWADYPSRWSVRSFDAVVKHLPPASVYIVDEAQYAKTENTARTRSLLGPGSLLHEAPFVWALSGTPAPNNVLELWTWLFFMKATTLSRQAFLARYCKYREGPYGPRISGVINVPELRALLAPVLLRRMKKDVQKDLPPIMWGEISLVSGKSEIGVSDTLSVDEALLPGDDEHLARARRLLGEAKAPVLASFLSEELAATTKKIVVMAHHTSVLDVLSQRLGKFGVARIDGSTPQARRGAEVDKFQDDPRCRVFIGQLQAAGTAITLTAACDFIFAEMSWVPGENWQAAMRVHRIGQTMPVLIRVASLEGSLDEAVSRVLTRKTRLLEQVI